MRHTTHTVFIFKLLQPDPDSLGLGQGHAAGTGRSTIWDHRCGARSIWIASSLRADMIFGKDRSTAATFTAVSTRPFSTLRCSRRCRAGLPPRRWRAAAKPTPEAMTGTAVRRGRMLGFNTPTPASRGHRHDLQSAERESRRHLPVRCYTKKKGGTGLGLAISSRDEVQGHTPAPAALPSKHLGQE